MPVANFSPKLYIYTYLCTQIYLHTYIHTHIYKHIYTYIFTHTHTHTHIYTHIYIYIHTHIYIYIYIYTHTHKYMYIFIYIYGGTQKILVMKSYLHKQRGLTVFFEIIVYLLFDEILKEYCLQEIMIEVYISSSSSCRAASTDIPDPLSPLLPIIHRLRQVFRVTSCVLT